MKKLLAIIVLSLCLITPSQADDISDFQIGGISVGDYLSSYYTENELSNGVKTYYPNKKFYLLALSSKDTNYDNIQLALKRKDKNFKIYGITGAKPKPFSDCLKKQKEITKEITAQFNNLKVVDKIIYNHPADKTGKSKKKDVEIVFTKTSELIVVDCINWSKKITKKNGWMDNLGVSLYSKEYENWLRNEAFN